MGTRKSFGESGIRCFVRCRKEKSWSSLDGCRIALRSTRDDELHVEAKAYRQSGSCAAFNFGFKLFY